MKGQKGLGSRQNGNGKGNQKGVGKDQEVRELGEKKTQLTSNCCRGVGGEGRIKSYRVAVLTSFEFHREKGGREGPKMGGWVPTEERDWVGREDHIPSPAPVGRALQSGKKTIDP